MGIFDKLKQAATDTKDKISDFSEKQKITEKITEMKDAVKKSWDDSTASMKANSEENKLLKQPLEGSIIRYEVIYLEGSLNILKQNTEMLLV